MLILSILQIVIAVGALLVPVIFSRDMSRIQIVIWVALGIALLIVGVLQVRYEHLERKATAVAGTLEAPTASGENPSHLPLRIGRSCAIFAIKMSSGSRTFPLFNPWEGWYDQPIFLSIRDGYMFLNATLRDEEGNVVAVLRDNEWQVNENNYFDRNYSSNALEVVDNKDRVVLQVITTESEVLFSALLTGPDGQTFTFVGTDGEGAMMDKGAKNEPLDLEIPRYFKYPSDTHLGELTDYGKRPIRECPQSATTPSSQLMRPTT